VSVVSEDSPNSSMLWVAGVVKSMKQKIDCAVASTDALQSVVLHSMPQSVASGFLQLRYEKPRHYVMETNHNYQVCSRLRGKSNSEGFHTKIRVARRPAPITFIQPRHHTGFAKMFL
jgi:hypothetical protein